MNRLQKYFRQQGVPPAQEQEQERFQDLPPAAAVERGQQEVQDQQQQAHMQARHRQQVHHPRIDEVLLRFCGNGLAVAQEQGLHH